jgi:hypothetical protein
MGLQLVKIVRCGCGLPAEARAHQEPYGNMKIPGYEAPAQCPLSKVGGGNRDHHQGFELPFRVVPRANSSAMRDLTNV